MRDALRQSVPSESAFDRARKEFYAQPSEQLQLTQTEYDVRVQCALFNYTLPC